MHYDWALVSQVESLADGRSVHHVPTMLSNYKQAYNFAICSNLETDIKLFQETEAQLRAFVAKKKIEKYEREQFQGLRF